MQECYNTELYRNMQPAFNKYVYVSKVSKTWIYTRKTSNALITLVKAKKDCLKELPKTIKTTRWIYEYIW